MVESTSCSYWKMSSSWNKTWRKDKFSWNSHKYILVRLHISWNLMTHKIHENCHSVMFYFMEKLIFWHSQEVHFTNMTRVVSPKSLWVKCTSRLYLKMSFFHEKKLDKMTIFADFMYTYHCDQYISIIYYLISAFNSANDNNINCTTKFSTIFSTFTILVQSKR